MNIWNKSGEEYDLTPDVSLEIERANPFFNDFGEQSLPVTLPPTEKNRRLLSFPDDLAEVSKASQRMDARIQHGAYSMCCRQAILTGNKKAGMETSFYLNTGAFYEKINDVSLTEIFEDHVLTFNTVADAIEFCRNLYINYDERFACFPARIDGAILNNLAWKGTGFTDYPDLYNAIARTRKEDGKDISLEPGYYITPFIRANFLLKEVLAHFGYTLIDNFFTQTEPFRSMVFVNDNIDTLMKAEIRLVQILPNCTISTLLDFYRNMFNCDFIPDEVNRTIDICLFDDVLAQETDSDISHLVVGKYTIEHPETFKQIKLSANYLNTVFKKGKMSRIGGKTEDEKDSYNNFGNVRELLAKYPDVEFNKVTGGFYRRGFRGIEVIEQTVGFVSCDYYAGGPLTVVEKKAECTICAVTQEHLQEGRNFYNIIWPYVGEGRALNSTIIMDSVNIPSDETSEDMEHQMIEAGELPIIPCFVGRHSTGLVDFGTTMNYDDEGNKLWEYTLAFSGPDGLFEHFWRNRDNLLRNSMLKVNVPLLLSDADKLKFSDYKKVMLDGQELFPDVIKFAVDRNDVFESTFYTTRLYEPLSTAIPESERIPANQGYKWMLKYTRSNPINPGRTRNFSFVEEPTVVFYAPPTAAQYEQGGKFYERTFPVKFFDRTAAVHQDGDDGTVITWLEPTLE